MSPSSVNAAVAKLTAPPVAIVQDWIARYDGASGPLLDLSQAVPGYPPDPRLLEALAAAARDPDSLGYGPIRGEPALREAFATHVCGVYGAAVSSSQVLMSAGCNQAFVLAALAVAGAGDEVLMTRPGYFNHESSLHMLGIRVGYVPVAEARGFLPDVAAVAAAIGPRTRALVLVTPNNPTGAIYPPALLADLRDVCRRHGIWLIIDETYRDFLLPVGGRPHDLLADPGWTDTVIQLYSFSKAYCIPGHRLGAVVAADELVDEMAKVMDNIQICAPRVAQRALPRLLGTLADWRHANAVRMAGRAQAFADAMVAAPGWRIVSIGGYFAYVRHPFQGRDAHAVAESLARSAGILTIPGTFFGTGQQAYVRFAFANASRAEIAAVGARLAEFERGALPI
jgi:aspartate/methionine/tyrosine aminotransferase